MDDTPIGNHEVNTVFFEDVKVPKENLIGEEGKGWTYAKYYLSLKEAMGIHLNYILNYKRLLNRPRRKISVEINWRRSLNFKRPYAKIEVQINAMEARIRILGSLTAGQNVDLSLLLKQEERK